MSQKRKSTSVLGPSQSTNNAERCKLYREQRKLDPNFREKERKRKEKYRLNRTEEKKQHDRELCRNRMRKLREKQKQLCAEVTTGNSQKHRTRQQVITSRHKWKEAKRNYRSQISAQKKRRVREKDRERKREARKRTRAKRQVSQTENATSAYNTPAAARKAISRVFNHFPKETGKFNSVLCGVLKKATKLKVFSSQEQTATKGRKMDFLENAAEAFKECYHSLKETRKEKDKRLRQIMAKSLSRMKKYRLLRKSSREIGLRWGTLIKWSKLGNSFEGAKKPHMGALTDSTTKAVKDFYLKPYVSVSHADKKSVLKRLGKQKHSMSVTLKAAHETFLHENPAEKVSFSKFAKLKPAEVQTLKDGKFRTCLCETCTNLEMMLKVLNKKGPSVGDKYKVARMTLCPYGKGSFPNLICVQRECQNCGVHQLKDSLGPFLESSESVRWHQWQNCKVFDKKSNTEKTRKMLMESEGTLKQLAQNVLDALDKFANHLFCATWQHKKFTEMKNNLRPGHTVAVLDFAENYTVHYQDECQSAHWCKKQVTIHPVVCYYKDQKSVTKTHEIVFISDDLVHDNHMVHKITGMSFEILRASGVELSKMTQFTDGCSAQYKSRVPFMDVSLARKDFDMDFERNYFGSGHGKGPSDGCSGVVKSCVTRATKGGTAVVRDAKEFFDFCESQLTKDTETFKRSFHFISTEEIVRDRPERTDALTVKGTRALHSVRPDNKPGHLQVRRLSCSCQFCVYKDGNHCTEQDFIQPWKVVTLRQGLPAPVEPQNSMGGRRKNRKRTVEGPDDGSKSGGVAKKTRREKQNIIEESLDSTGFPLADLSGNLHVPVIHHDVFLNTDAVECLDTELTLLGELAVPTKESPCIESFEALSHLENAEDFTLEYIAAGAMDMEANVAIHADELAPNMPKETSLPGWSLRLQGLKNLRKGPSTDTTTSRLGICGG